MRDLEDIVGRAIFTAETGDASAEGWFAANKDKYERMASAAILAIEIATKELGNA